MKYAIILSLAALILVGASWSHAGYVNYESSHVNPITLTPSGARLLVVNTPDAVLESYSVLADGSLQHERSIPVGLEPVSVRARSDGEAWVVSHLSDTVSVVDLVTGRVVRTLETLDEPNDVDFASGRAFVSAATADAVSAYDLADLSAPPTHIPVFGREPRSLAASSDGTKIYAVALKSGNQTAIVGNHAIFPSFVGLSHDQARLDALGIGSIFCDGPRPPYPPLPAGITRNPELDHPFATDGVPKVGLIVRWDEASGQWLDEAGQDWTNCLPYRLPDHDLFVIDATTLGVSTVDHLGTTLLSVSVNPANGKIYVPHTDARNFVRFEHPLGLQGHIVENRMSIVDPANSNAITIVDLNAHIDRQSDPSTNLAERQASIAQPGMMAWRQDGTKAYMTSLGSRRVFEVDGACTSESCIVGPTRSTPRSVEVGHGPSGVALHEGKDRLYVLTRVSHTISVVQASTLTKLDEVGLHDPSDMDTRAGRQFLYDALDLSAHGDVSCSSCHVSGDTDGLTWDLGNPEGDFVPYSDVLDNVRHVTQINEMPVPCVPGSFGCTIFTGFDPQKGPLTTQTLRSVLEPLHWRADRATVRDFNGAFVNLQGALDISGPGQEPAGLTPQQMEQFRNFALGIRMAPNPNRQVDDTLPCGPRSTDPLCEVQHVGMDFPGNPTEGQQLFETFPSDNGQSCMSCHNSEFGTAGGLLGGVEPAEPTSLDATALFDGNFNASPHSDVEVAHLRNLYEKVGPAIRKPTDLTPPDAKAAFGYLHQGNMPDLYHYLSDNIFDLPATNQASVVRDIVAFLFSFPTDTKPAVGRQLTVPEGLAPTGSSEEESLLSNLLALGDLGDANRHCELTVATTFAGRAQNLHLSGGTWIPDSGNDAPVSTAFLRESATAPLTFLCATLGSGERLGGDRDEDAALNADDCAPADPDTRNPAQAVANLVITPDPAVLLTWNEQASQVGVSVTFDVLNGDVSNLALGFGDTECVSEDQSANSWTDTTAAPPPGAASFFLIRSENPCGIGDLGPGREVLETSTCMSVDGGGPS